MSATRRVAAPLASGRTAWVSVANKERVRSTPRKDLTQLHHGWGTGIRNAFGLWAGNKALPYRPPRGGDFSSATISSSGTSHSAT